MEQFKVQREFAKHRQSNPGSFRVQPLHASNLPIAAFNLEPPENLFPGENRCQRRLTGSKTGTLYAPKECGQLYLVCV